MGMKDFFKQLGGNREANDGLPDDVTRDKVLKSLRRERRIQLEKNEKIRLRKKIADFKRKEVSEGLFGIKGPAIKSKSPLGKTKGKKVKFTDGTILKDKKKSMLSKGKFF